MHFRPALLVLLSALAASCGPPSGVRHAQRLLARGDYAGADAEADRELARFPKHPTLWQVKVRAAMGRGDNATAVKHYETWHQMRGADDASLLRIMAKTVLWQALRSPSAELKVAAIQTIEQLEIEELAHDVGELVLDDDDWVAAAASVAVLRADPAAPRVATDLLRSDDARARSLVVAGIARKVGKRAHDDLAPMMNDRDAGVRRAAVTAIGAMKLNADTARLLALAAKDPDGPVRASALAALTQGDRSGVVPAAERALDDSYLGARLAAVALLAKRGGDAGRARLATLVGGTDRFVALRAAVALVRAGSTVDVEGPLAALDDPSPSLRAAATAAVAELVSKKRALELLGRRLVDSDPTVALAAARALLSLGVEDQARPMLYKLLTAHVDAVRVQAAKLLLPIDEKEALTTLSALCGAADPGTREAAVRAHTAGHRPSTGLVAALADEDAQVRIAAADTLLLLARGR